MDKIVTDYLQIVKLKMRKFLSQKNGGYYYVIILLYYMFNNYLNIKTIETLINII